MSFEFRCVVCGKVAMADKKGWGLCAEHQWLLSQHIAELKRMWLMQMKGKPSEEIILSHVLKDINNLT